MCDFAAREGRFVGVVEERETAVGGANLRSGGGRGDCKGLVEI